MPVPDKEGRRQAGGDPSLRSATAADAEFAYLVLEQTMRRHAVATWGAWLESQARAAMTADACAGRSQVIALGTVPVGLLRLDRHATHLQLEQLFVLPAYQRMGMGERVFKPSSGRRVRSGSRSVCACSRSIPPKASTRATGSGSCTRRRSA